MENKHTTRRTLRGIVMSDKMDKTRAVEVRRTKQHPKYKKRLTVSKRYLAHDQRNEYHVGDAVFIQETRPLSRQKRWRISGRIQNV